VPAETVRATVRETGAPLVTSVRLFDVFRSDALGPGRRSLAYTVRFQAPDRTLTDPEVAEVRQRIIEAVESIDGATLRS
jgi:phenylalanyl-tRNA synthetase beta chain